MNYSAKFDSSPKPIVLGSYINALGIIRSLGFSGYTSIAIDFKKSVASVSKFAQFVMCPNPIEFENQFRAFFIDLGKQFSSKPIVFCTADHWLTIVNKYRREFEEYYIFPMSQPQILEKCYDKEKLYSEIGNIGIPIPKTYIAKNISELEALTDSIAFPMILKPAQTTGFAEALGSKGRALQIDGKSEFKYWINLIREKGLGELRFILQDFIPGGAENLFTVTSYSNQRGEILGYSIGHKIRQYPPSAGTIVSGRVTPKPELFWLTQKVIKYIGYYGIANTEYKFDPRDGDYKLMEINPRPGMWNFSAYASGVNLPLMALNESLGKTVGYMGTSDKELVWAFFLHDFLISICGTGYSQDDKLRCSMKSWLKSIRGKWVDAVFSWKDPLPFMYLAVLGTNAWIKSSRKKA